MSSRRPTAVALAVTVLVALAASGCAKQHDRATATVEDREQSVKVELVDEAFRPLTVGAQGGLPMTVHLHNRGLQHHTFTDDGAGIDVDLGPGQERTVNLPAHPAGTNRYFLCRFHEANGMKGKISYVTEL